MPPEFQDDDLARARFRPATPATLRTARAVRKQLAAIRDTGFAYSHEEWTQGIIGIGIAVLDAAGTLMVAINVAVPTARFGRTIQHEAEATLKRVAGELRRQLGPPWRG